MKRSDSLKSLDSSHSITSSGSRVARPIDITIVNRKNFNLLIDILNTNYAIMNLLLEKMSFLGLINFLLSLTIC